jgi:hypothetical protein
MAESDQKGRLVALDDHRIQPDPPALAVFDCLEAVLDEHEEFSAVLVICVVGNPAEYEQLRVFSTGLDHLRKVGLLEKAKDAIR